MAGQREIATQVIPPAVGTNLDHITSGVLGAATQLSHVFGGEDATPPGGQAGTEGERHQHQVGPFTYGTRFVTDGGDVARRPQEFGVGVADIAAAQATPAELVDDVLASQPIVDLAGRRIAP